MNDIHDVHMTSRRQFVQIAGMATAGLIASRVQAAEPVILNKKDGMAYRRLGRTGLMVSELSLGGDPAIQPRIFAGAMEAGVNFVDTSPTYVNGQSEITYGELIKGQRDKIIISTKFHPDKNKTAESLVAEVDASLKRLQMDHVDILYIHYVESVKMATEDYVLSAFETLKKAGKIRFTGVSGHNKVMTRIPPIMETGKYDVFMLNFNVYEEIEGKKDDKMPDLFKASKMDSLFELAKKQDAGIVAMKVQAGGNRQNLDKYISGATTAAQAKIKWALSRPEVASVVSRITNAEQLKDNLGAVGRQLTSLEHRRLREYCSGNSAEVCRMCGACEQVCPQGLMIPDILRFGMYSAKYGEPDLAKAQYKRLAPSATYAFCRDCGACEKICPYGVAIRTGLKTAHNILA